MPEPKRASDTPYAVEVEEGKSYWWCSCGLSNQQPFAMDPTRAESLVLLNIRLKHPKKYFFVGVK